VIPFFSTGVVEVSCDVSGDVSWVLSSSIVRGKIVIPPATEDEQQHRTITTTPIAIIAEDFIVYKTVEKKNKRGVT
jgi:hypothetical protein